MEQFQPQVVVVEQLYAHYDHPRTAILMAHARGVIFLAAGQRRSAGGQLQCHADQEDHHRQRPGAKDRCSGRSSASWAWPNLPEPPDVADALAAALCHYYLPTDAAGVRSRP